jgi:hypothetical protein
MDKSTKDNQLFLSLERREKEEKQIVETFIRKIETRKHKTLFKWYFHYLYTEPFPFS